MAKIKINPPTFREDSCNRSFYEVLSDATNVCMESIIKKAISDVDYKTLLIQKIKNKNHEN